ncbi:MAG: hypothetical protein HYV97_00995 [Bdellovibrio sp.]|nr:hypothetical protein [Bdellovibrio sp.]
MSDHKPTADAFRKIRIDALISYGAEYQLELYLRLSDEKFIKVSQKEDNFESILEKYKNRGVTEVYLTLADYDYFTTSVRKAITARLSIAVAEPTKPPEISLLAGAHDVLKSLILRENTEEDTLAVAQALTQGTVKTIHMTNLLGKFSEFKKKCSREFTYALLTSQVACLMVDQFNWANDAVKEKVALAAMLCDVELLPEDFDLLKDSGLAKENLTKKITFHPLNTAHLLAKESKFFSQETLTIVEQHHEMPSGGGFPKGISYQRISQLTAIYIVAHYFVDQMFDKTYREALHADRCRTVVELIKNQFVSGVFRKASEALASVFDQGKMA